MMENPWKKLSKKKVYENHWIKVEEHQVLNPASKKGIYGTVHFKHLAIGIIPIDEDGYSHLVGQYRFPLDQYSWEIPEGGGKMDLHPLESAKRELEEETGILAGKWEEIQRIHTSNSVTDELGIIYLARELSYTEPKPDEDEKLQLKKLHWKEMLQLVLKGEITDSLSVAGIMKLALMMEKDN